MISGEVKGAQLVPEYTTHFGVLMFTESNTFLSGACADIISSVWKAPLTGISWALLMPCLKKNIKISKKSNWKMRVQFIKEFYLLSGRWHLILTASSNWNAKVTGNTVPVALSVSVTQEVNKSGEPLSPTSFPLKYCFRQQYRIKISSSTHSSGKYKHYVTF